MKRKIITLFKDLCCSKCKSDFNEESVSIMREEDDMIIFKLSCPNCDKNFGVAFLGISDFNLKSSEQTDDDDFMLKVHAGIKPISKDDVLDAHKFIKNLDKNWPKFISDLWHND